MRVLGAMVGAVLVAALLLMAGQSRVLPAEPVLAVPSSMPDPLPTPDPRGVPAEFAGLLKPRWIEGVEDAPLVPQAIVLHSTGGLPLATAIEEMTKRKRPVHVIVDADGTAWQLLPFDRQARAARGLDDVAIHVSAAGGVGEDLTSNLPQLEATARIVGALAARFGIFLSNHDVIGRAGVFSHMQCKYRYGGLRRGEPKGRMEPGEDFVEEVLRRCGGTFFAEEKWKARTAEGWLFVLEEPGSGSRAKLAKGRDLTPLPPAALASVEQADGKLLPDRRMKYVDRGRMAEVRGIVLHFSATETYGEAVTAFENRRLGPHIIVDTDAKAYQCVDALDDMVVAAAGTNEHCLQIEIVGEGQDPLLKNRAQTAKVVEVVKELAGKYRIPLTNEDIDERRGVFSHGQAKKRWGRSAWLWGRDFDPGEQYMKVALEGAGGVYVPEEKWKGRQSGSWVIECEDWLP